MVVSKQITPLLLLLLVSSLLGAEPPRRILFIGNSYTGGIHSTLNSFVNASPHRDAQLEFITPGGKDLLFHADQKETIERIRDGKWDIVVLQDQSQTPAVMPARFLDGARRLHEIVAKSGARTAYFETWGRRDGDKRNIRLMPTFEKMQDALTASYTKAAERDKAILVPVGKAWRRVREQHPALGKELYRKDGSHPSVKGAYLATLCFYICVFDADPSKIEYTGGLSADVVRKLRAAATDALKHQ